MSKVEELVVTPVARRLQQDHMRRLGIANTMRLAGAYNRLRFRREDAYRREQYRRHFDALLDENGPLKCPPIVMEDGYAIDTSGNLPHLEELLQDCDTIIEERAGTRTSDIGTYRSFFQQLYQPGDAERFPSLLDFATSSDVVRTVAGYLESIPVMSTTLPQGIRVVESNAAYDDEDAPHDSQLYHIDYYSKPNVYVLVTLRDTTIENGPWTFLPLSDTDRAKKALGYWGREHGYRLSDEQVYGAADPAREIRFTYPRGTVLFIESSGCLHFGSRNSVQPRFQLFLGYSGICRTDFSELIMAPKLFPVRPTDSRLRRMVLDKGFIE